MFSTFFSLVSAQTMNLALDGEVRLDAGDLDGRSYFPKYDQNDELCALIKVTVTNKLKNPLSLETGAAGVMERQERENGEIWFWVPYQVKNLKFSCFEYTPLPTIPVKLERGKVYRLTLRSDAQVQTFTNVSATFNFLKLQILPADAGNAFVSIGKTSAYELDAQYAVDGMYSSSIPLDYGEYYCRIEHKLYETYEGKVKVDEQDKTHKVQLRPAYGYLKVTSEPSGATVAINNERVGTTPWQSSEKMPKGAVEVRVQLNNYALSQQNYTIQGNGQVQTHHVRLTPQFGTVTCRSEMSDAEIWVDQQQVGVGSWTGPLSSQGTHILEARKAGHQSQSISFTVGSGETVTKTVGAPIPMYGTLVLSSTPAGCEVWLDGKQQGTTPKVEQLLVGKHEIVLKKSGYEDVAFEVEIQHNQRRDEKRTMKQAVVASAASGSTRGGDKGSGAQGATLTADYGMEFVFVEGGTFQMGATAEQGSDAYDDEKPVHSVILSDYCIGKYEVTQAQWEAVMGSNPSEFKGDNLPVERVSWKDVQEFIAKLNEKTGKTYRLPTEAEWEYAARGGNKSQGYKYSGSNEIDEVAWYLENSGDATHPVGQKQPNELGLYDMTGNIYEWCQDWYGGYSSGSQTNPSGPANGSYRVLRGGSWNSNARQCRVSNRGYNYSSLRYSYRGFRLVLGELPPLEELEEDPLEALEALEALEKSMVFVEGGTFQMGATSEQGSDAQDDEKPVHSVTLSDYYIGKYEVTQAQWEAVMGSNPSHFEGDNLPVKKVSWDDIQEFIAKLNQKTGKTYRLPTEAEWEYAARGGNKSQGFKYAGSNKIGEVAWYDGNRGKKMHSVGQKKPNELGLYDMSGNVLEWCQDWYGAYSSGSQTNPQGPSSGSTRVLRGGSWGSKARFCRVSYRNLDNPSSRLSNYGFRLVLVP